MSASGFSETIFEKGGEHIKENWGETGSASQPSPTGTQQVKPTSWKNQNDSQEDSVGH